MPYHGTRGIRSQIFDVEIPPSDVAPCGERRQHRDQCDEDGESSERYLGLCWNNSISTSDRAGARSRTSCRNNRVGGGIDHGSADPERARSCWSRRNRPVEPRSAS